MLILAVIAVCSFIGARFISAVGEPQGLRPEEKLLAQKRTDPVYRVITDASAIKTASAGGAAASAGGGGGMSGEEVFKATCHTCHVPGVLGAPKISDKAEWQKRLSEQGLEKLYANAVNGIGSMPPKGGNASLSKEEVHAAVDFILSKAGIQTAAAATSDEGAADEAAAADKGESEASADKKSAQASGAEDKTSADKKASGNGDETKAAEQAADKQVADKQAADEQASDQQQAGDEQASGEQAAPAGGAAAAIDKEAATTTGKKVFKALCHTCHVPGIAGAPKVSEAAGWEKRLSEQGLDKLYYNAIHGLGAMPPRGGDASLSDAEVKAAVNFMLLKSGAVK